MKTIIQYLSFTVIMFFGLMACSDDTSLSGRYVSEIEGNSMAFDFRDDSNVTFSMTEGGQTENADCTYTSSETRISVSCVGSSGISLTRVGKDLDGDMGGVILRFKKR